MKRYNIHPLGLLVGVICFVIGSNLAIYWSHEFWRMATEEDEEAPSETTEQTEPERPEPAPDEPPPGRVRHPSPGSAAPLDPVYRDLPGRCGSLRAVHHGRAETIAPTRTDYDVDIRGDLASVTVEQTFANPTETALDAVYQFPLNRKAAVYAMSMEVDGRVVHAEIQRKEEARRSYERAKRRGKQAALLSQKRPNWFTQRVANIAPDATVDITLRYVHALPMEDGAHQLVLPMQVGPRFGAGGTSHNGLIAGTPDAEPLPIVAGNVSDALRASGSRAGVSVDVRIDAPMPVEAIASSSHTIRVQEYDRRDWRVGLADSRGAADEHFRLRFRMAGDQPRAGVNAYWDDEANKGYFNLLVEPPETPDRGVVRGRELVFVLDTSGSMRGRPLRASKRFVRRSLKQLRRDDAFRIVRFSNRATGFSSEPVPATPEHVERALGYVDRLRAGGGTQYRPGIERALDPATPEGRMRMVVFLTDGLIGYERKVLGLLERKIGEARLYGLGVGGRVNRYLLEEMGRMGRGFARFLDPGEALDDQIDRAVRRIRSPVMTDLRVDWGSLHVDGVTPDPTPDLFAGEPVRVHGTYTNPGRHTVTVEGDVAGERVAMDLEVMFPETTSDGRAVELTWARRRIADQMHRYAAGRLHADEREAIRERVVGLGLEHSLVTEWTSFVAVDERGEAAATGRRHGSRPTPAKSGDTLTLGAKQRRRSSGSSGRSLGSLGAKRTKRRGVGGLGVKGAARGGGGGTGFGRVGGVGGGGTGAERASKETSDSASVAPGQPTVEGALSKSVIRRVVGQHRREIRHCYERALKRDPSLEGRVEVQFTISPSGTVVAALVQKTTLDDTSTEACVNRMIRRWSFPNPKGGVVVVVTYPF